jgi:leucyl-tRNA synthetase
VNIAVQVNGKLRGAVHLPAGVEKDEAIAAAKAEPNVGRFMEGKTIRKEVFVPGRLVNFVVS